MGRSEFLMKLAETLNRPAVSVTDDTVLSGETLDSLALLSVAAAADEEYGVNVPPGALAQCRSVGELVVLVESLEPGADLFGADQLDS